MAATLVQTDLQVQRVIERVAYGIEEAAEAMGLGVTSFSALVQSGEIPSFRVGRRRLIKKSDLLNWVDSQPTGGS